MRRFALPGHPREFHVTLLYWWRRSRSDVRMAMETGLGFRSRRDFLSVIPPGPTTQPEQKSSTCCPPRDDRHNSSWDHGCAGEGSGATTGRVGGKCRVVYLLPVRTDTKRNRKSPSCVHHRRVMRRVRYFGVRIRLRRSQYIGRETSMECRRLIFTEF